MCENFRKDFFDNVMKQVGDETLFETLNKNFQFTYNVCRNFKSAYHPNCKKYYVKLRAMILGDSCSTCTIHFCESCYATSLHAKPNSYTMEKICIECLMDKEYFKPQALLCPMCSNNNSTLFVFDSIFDSYFCYNCRSKIPKHTLRQSEKVKKLTSTGNSQDTATPIANHYNIVTFVPLKSGVVLPEPKKYEKITIVNKGENDLKIYPSIGCNIYNRNINEPTTLSRFETITFVGETSLKQVKRDVCSHNDDSHKLYQDEGSCGGDSWYILK